MCAPRKSARIASRCGSRPRPRRCAACPIPCSKSRSVELSRRGVRRTRFHPEESRMKPMPWRILVLTEPGLDRGEATRLDAGGADAWLAAIDARVEVPKPGGGTVALEPRDAAGFSPAAVGAALGAGANAAAIDAALHAPAFQRLESAWRGLALFAKEAGDAVEIEVQ